MRYNNKKQLSFLKKSLMVLGLTMLLAMAATIFLQQFEIVIVLSALFVVGVVLTRILNFSYLYLQLENEKLMIRFYSLFSVDRDYESIEFPVASLRRVEVKKYLFGLKWDLHLSVRLKQGLAGYPPICLSALSFADREKLVKLIGELVRHPEH